MWPLVTDEGVVVGMCIAARETGKYKMLQSQLRQTQKLEAVGRLSGGIAHDFNNLLTVISGYNDMIRAELPVNSPTWEWAVEVSKAAEQATSLTNQLLAFSRREVTQPRVLCLNDMVTDLDKMLQRIVGEDIRIVISLQPKLENIKADPGQVSQMLTNLVINARDAMPQGGTVTIATDSVYFNPTVAAEPDMAPGLYIRLRVSDSGCGMDRETQQHLFEPFFTTKPRGKGTGLGLSIVYGIVSQLRGQISVASEVGVGTAFAICLPATTEQPIARRVAQAETPRPMSPDITILLVEDDGGVRHLARHMLLKFGYTVYETGDPLEAIRICSAIHIDVLLTDIVMPVMSGPDLAVTLLTSNEHLKVVYMSGHIDDSILPQSCMDPGINFIRKPFTATRLNEQIMDVRKQGCQLPSTTGSLTT